MKRQLSILVVDDEPVQRESIAVWLTEDGYRVDTVGSGLEAIDRARSTDYVLYLLDLKMPPGMDGIETMREIRMAFTVMYLFINRTMVFTIFLF